MNNPTRRSILLGTLASPLAARAQDNDTLGTLLTEQQQGDPGTPPESVTIDPGRIDALTSAKTLGAFRERDAGFGERLVAVSERFVGFDRTKNRSAITDFLDLFDLPFEHSGGFTAYCAAGLGYVAALAYTEFWGRTARTPSITRLRQALPVIERYHFRPTPLVKSMVSDARKKGRWRTKPKEGYVVVYSFDGGVYNHCGVVKSVAPTHIVTIEFNTSNGRRGDQRQGGMVAERTRRQGPLVAGYIATDIPAMP